MGELTKDQLIKIGQLVSKETSMRERSATRMVKQTRADGQYLWIEYSDGTQKSIKFLSNLTRDAAFAAFKEQANVRDGEAG